MSYNNFVQMKKDSTDKAWVIYGCSSLEEAKSFAVASEGEVLELSDDELIKLNIKLDFGY